LAFWDLEKKRFNVRLGQVKIMVGASSAFLPLESDIMIV
jgi:hypothetical protein